MVEWIWSNWCATASVIWAAGVALVILGMWQSEHPATDFDRRHDCEED